jgi:hypothetical protein
MERPPARPARRSTGRGPRSRRSIPAGLGAGRCRSAGLGRLHSAGRPRQVRTPGRLPAEPGAHRRILQPPGAGLGFRGEVWLRAPTPRWQPHGRPGAARAVQDQLGKPIAVKGAHVTLAGTKDERHLVGQQPPGDEQQRLGRGRVQPLSVIHHGDDRALLRGLAQQAQRRDEDHKPVHDGALLLAERSAHCPRLRRGQPVQVRQQGRSSRCNAANASGDSDSMPCVHNTCAPAARDDASDNSADLPTPGSPRTTTTPPRPAAASANKASSRALSEARPYSTPPTLPSGPDQSSARFRY